MSSSRIFKYIVQFLVLVGVQILFFKDFVFFNTAFCFAYAGAFLLLPFELGTVAIMLLAFGAGLAVDFFYDTLGIHAAASVLTAFLRGPLQAALTPAGGYEEYMEPTAPSMGVQWFLLYLAPLLFIQAFAVFMIEYSDWTMIALAAAKAAATAVLSLVMVLLLQNVLVPRG